MQSFITVDIAVLPIVLSLFICKSIFYWLACFETKTLYNSNTLSLLIALIALVSLTSFTSTAYGQMYWHHHPALSPSPLPFQNPPVLHAFAFHEWQTCLLLYILPIHQTIGLLLVYTLHSAPLASVSEAAILRRSIPRIKFILRLWIWRIWRRP